MASIQLSEIQDYVLGQHLTDWGDLSYDEVLAALRGDNTPEIDFADWSTTGLTPWEPFEGELPRYMATWISNGVYTLRRLMEKAGVVVVL